MPKESFVIKGFDKGLITHKDARDLDIDSVYLSTGMSYSYSGRVRLFRGSIE